LGAMETQLLCPRHLSLSMMIFISPPYGMISSSERQFDIRFIR
jgi:hypothetical protein